MADLTINDQIIHYDRNGWVIFPLDRKTSKAAYLGRNGTDLVNAMGVVLVSLTEDQVQGLMSDAAAARDEARASETVSARMPYSRSSVSAFEYRSLANTLGADLAAQMARQMQG